MKNTRLFIGVICCMLALLASCKEDSLPSAFSQGRPVSAVFRVCLSLADNMSRISAEAETPGNDMECRIHTLHLFAVPVVQADNGLEEEDWSKVSLGNTTLKDGEAVTSVEVPVDLQTSGKMNLYIGANLSLSQVNDFLISREYRVKGSRYYQAINEFAPFITDETATNRQPENIAMFCHRATSVEVKDFDAVRASGNREVIDVGTVELRRMVAKVLVTCTTKDDYVPLKGDLADAEPLGWIRQENVYYFVNNMSRKAQFIRQQAEDGSGELQPYYNLREAMNTLAESLVPLRFNDPKVRENFIHYDQLQLYQYNRSFQRSSVWSEEEYDKLTNASGESAYSKEKTGMYTLENLYEMKEEDFSEEELVQMWKYGALPMITHVSIAAKFTPKFLYATKEEWNEMKYKYDENEVTATPEPDGDYYQLKCESEDISGGILTRSLKMNGGLIEGNGEYDPANPAKFPEETFFVYYRPDEMGGGIAYCTYGTAVSFNDKGSLDESMVPYTRGWGYYYTYINNNEHRAITTPGQLKDAGVERNHYYILNVQSIGALGTTVTDPKYMRVHTLKAGWQSGGSGGITLN